MADPSAGIWGIQPDIDPEAERRSREIDEALRRDRVEKLQEKCVVTILAPSGAHPNRSRHVVASAFAGAVGVTPAQEDKADVVARGETKDGHNVEVVSFPSPAKKKDKGFQIKLATLEPAILVYIVSVDADVASQGKDKLASALKKTLAHLLFAAQHLGNLQDTTICILLTNVAQLRDALHELETDASFYEQLKLYFPDMASSKAQDMLLGFQSELEVAAGRVAAKPKATRVISFEEDFNDSAANASGVTALLLSLVDQVQQGRIADALGADINSRFENTVTAKEAQQAIERQQKERESQPQPGALQSFNTQQIAFLIVALLLAIALTVFLGSGDA